MDLEGSTRNSQLNDIDQNLLLQFSCMNTTDRDELVGQLQKLLGPHLNTATASFFLDMNNWNLQGAVCSYLDLAIPARLPSMRSKDPDPLPLVRVQPGKSFECNFTIMNNGIDYWPGSCKLSHINGEAFGSPSSYVPPLAPSHSITVTLNCTAPESYGLYTTNFRMITPQGDHFGEMLWASISVEPEGGVGMDVTDKPASTLAPGDIEQTHQSSQSFIQDEQMD